MALMFFIVISLAILQSNTCEGSYDHFRLQDLDLAAHYLSNDLLIDSNNSSLGLPSGCTYCAGESFYHEPPPDDIILFIPPPPIHPSFQNSLSELYSNNPVKSNKQLGEQCNLCGLFYNGGEQLVSNNNNTQQNLNDKIVFILASFLLISGILFVYLFSSRKKQILETLRRNNFFKANNQAHSSINTHTLDKNNSFHESITNSGVHITDPCFLQTNGDKNLTSPIISDHVSHKKTSIPSKCWTQPTSIIGRTIRRIPNEYEIPSSRTNSTGTSSAVYADMNNEHNNSRCFAPYNLHTYAEVREVLDPNEHFHTSSNSSVMLSDSNYDNAVFPHNSNCVLLNGATMTGASSGSVQMSDFNSMRPVQSMNYGQTNSMNHTHQINQARPNPNNGQLMYEQVPQRAQVMITSNNQGVNPTLLSYNIRVRNVI